MKTQASQQSTPKASCKYFGKQSHQQRTPIRQDHFLNLYEKYLNSQGRKRSQQMNEDQGLLQQSTSLHYLNQKQDVQIHRLSLDSFNSQKNVSKGLKSYLTTIDTSSSTQHQKVGYLPNKNDSSQGKSQTADGVSTEDLDRKQPKTTKVLEKTKTSLNFVDIICKTKRLADRLQVMNQKQQAASPDFTHLLKVNQQKKDSISMSDLKKIVVKTKSMLDQYKRENNLLNQNNILLNQQLQLANNQLKAKDEEIQRLRQMLFQL